MKDTSAVISSDSCHKSKDQKHIPSDDATRDNAKEYLRSMLNKLMRIRLSDGRILIGVFLCTDRDSNVILGSCSEYVIDQENQDAQPDGTNDSKNEIDSEIDPTLSIEPRILGLAMVPGKHIVSIHLDEVYSRSMTKAPGNSPIPSDRDLCIEGVSNINRSDENIDLDLEVATKKIESMYT